MATLLHETLLMILQILHLTSCINVYQLSKPYLSPFPPAPYCSLYTPYINTSIEYVKIWQVDTKDHDLTGIIYWTESYKTKCTTNFFGNIDKNIIFNKFISMSSLNEQFLLTKLKELNLDDQIPLINTPIYRCSWMTTQSYISSRTWIKKINIYHTIDGSIYADGDNWAYLASIKQWTDGVRYLFVPNTTDKCPKLVSRTYPGIISVTLNNWYITIPSVQLEFILPTQSPFKCYQNKSLISQTPSGYLISFPSLQNEEQRWPLSKIKSDLSTSHVIYELNHLQSLMDADLKLVSHNICLLRQFSWVSIFKNKNYNEIAKYISGNPWAIGKSYNSHILISIPEIYDSNCTLPIKRNIKNSSMLIHCPNKGDVYISPWNNCIENEDCEKIYEYGFWIQKENNVYMNYLDNKLIFDKSYDYLNQTQVTEFNNSLNYLDLLTENNILKNKSFINYETEINYVDVPFSEWINLVWNDISSIFNTIYVKTIIYIVISLIIIISFIKICKRITQVNSNTLLVK